MIGNLTSERQAGRNYEYDTKRVKSIEASVYSLVKRIVRRLSRTWDQRGSCLRLECSSNVVFLTLDSEWK